MPRLLEMAQELVEAVTAQRGGSLLVGSDGRPPVRRWEPRAAGANCWLTEVALVLVGTLDDVVTGFGVCHVERGRRPRAAGGARRLLRRTRGAGRGARAAAAGHRAVLAGGARGCRGVDGIALPGDREAKNFYESAGFKARLLTMYRGSTEPVDGPVRIRMPDGPGDDRAGTGRRGPGGGGMGIPISRASSGTYPMPCGPRPTAPRRPRRADRPA